MREPFDRVLVLSKRELPLFFEKKEGKGDIHITKIHFSFI